MAEELASKKTVRRGHRASTTRALGQVDGAVTAVPLDVSKVSQLKRSLEDKLQCLSTLDEEILLLTPEDNIEEEAITADEYKERIYIALSRLERIHLTPIRAASPTDAESARRSTSPSSSRGRAEDSTATDPPAPSVVSAGPKVKLPKISLPRFKGDPVQWTSFWDAYRSAIHCNFELSEVDKFNYLRSLLDHSALDAIAGLTLSSANYQHAIEILQKRFGNKQTIISKHMDTLIHTEAIASDRHLKELRRLFDNTESHVRSLKSLGIESSSYGAILAPVLLSKLPSDMRLIVSRKVSDSELDMEALLATFEEELTARERANIQVSRKYPDKQSTQCSALLSGHKDSKSEPQCAYCSQNHSSSSCSSVATTASRKQILKSSGRCFNCLRRGHVTRTCRSWSRCQKCKRKHHTSVCDDGQSLVSVSTIPKESGLDPAAAAFQSTQTTSTLCSGNRQTVLLQTARAVIYQQSDPRTSLEIRLILDSGSQKSYISERVRDLLKLEAVGEHALSIATFGAKKSSSRVCSVVRVGMSLRGYPPMELALYVMPTICEPLNGQPIAACIQHYPHLMGLQLADSSCNESSRPIDILIGSDYYWELVTGNVCKGTAGPIALQTKLGWVLSGPASQGEDDHCAVNLSATHVLHAEANPVDQCSLDEQLRSFWELESLGIHEEQEKTMYEQLAGEISFQDGHYKVPLPWREFHDPLPDNYDLSANRLKGLLRRLRHTPEILREYDDIIQDQLKRGVIEVVPTDETPRLTHYLPHHAVVKQTSSTTKIRIVYDASAKRGTDPSLNDCLRKGPKFNQLVFDLLVRFRAYKTAFTADLEKAFLMVSVEESDRDVLRFLWIDDITKESPDLKSYRFTRVVFGVSSSPFLLNATIRYHLESHLETDENVIVQLLRSTYVDDIIAGGETENEVLDLCIRSKEIFRKGGFNLRKFVTSSPNLRAQIDHLEGQETSKPSQDNEPTYSETTLGTVNSSGSDTEHKVLGVLWNLEFDQLKFDVTGIVDLARRLLPTKRNVVSIIGKFYDPLGFLSPVVIQFKILFQKLCKDKQSWDDVISNELEKEWKELISDLEVPSPIAIPRSYFTDVEESVTSVNLIGFCDASTKAYAAVVYIQLKIDSRIVTRFVASKSRVAPLQAQSIPRLELLSALLLSRLIISVRDSIRHQMTNIDIQCYTDSQIALYWITGITRDWKVFVENRVNEIRCNVNPNCWHHCAGDSNPADLPSRGLSMMELLVSKLWRFGPEWLNLDLHTSPEMQSSSIPQECLVELKSTGPVHNLLVVEETPGVGELIQCEKFGDLQRLFRVTAHVLRAVAKLKLRGRESSIVHTGAISSQEIADVEILWVSHVQKKMVQRQDFQALRNQLRLFLSDHDLWRCGGRLHNADIPYPVKYPILLPRDHPFTALVVKYAHERVCHNGVKETLTEVRSKYWILKGRSFVRSLIHKCIICKKLEGAPYGSPIAPPLPQYRLKDDPAFTYTGIDFAGPLQVKGTRSGKVWICLFTCLVTRAIHLDIVFDMTTGAFLRCLKRFAARRGLPRKILSDNGSTFKAAAKFITNVFRDKSVQQYLSSMKCQWIFNVEYAPWWGGVFERMVRSTKRCLRKMVGRASFTGEEMLTAVTEIECVINSRPLSYVSSLDIEEPLTPSHLMVGRRLLNLPDNLDSMANLDDEDFEVHSNQLSRRMNHLANVLNHFWKRWRQEYLSELREGHHYQAKKNPAPPPDIKKGDVVIVHDESLPRGLWKLGRVQEVFTGRDGLHRGALVRVAVRQRQQTLLKRPLRLLYPLEITPSEIQVDDVPEVSSDLQSTPSDETDCRESETRPTRAAAKRAEARRKTWIRELETTTDD